MDSARGAAEADGKKLRAVALDLVEESDLAVADDINHGGDPYNSTGRHVIIKSRLKLDD